ncbi:MAG: helix-turn-helix domain-containing protein [Tatlockia sp.]|nr:helix-turn-helix domain-containing protein [Tatlockia sp.]
MEQKIYNKPSLSRTFNILEAAKYLKAHKETVRRMAACGQLPVVKIGRCWCFIEEDLVMYIRSQYAESVTSQGAVKRSKQQWRFTKEMKLGGSASPTKDKEYNEALGLRTK